MPGIRIRPTEPASEDNPIDTELPLASAERLLRELPARQPAQRCGLLPATLRQSLQSRVERSHIIPYAVDGAILLEVYVHDGIGTMVVDEKLEALREATPDDVGGILQLIELLRKTAPWLRAAAPRLSGTWQLHHPGTRTA